jgi:hypothetical protein
VIRAASVAWTDVLESVNLRLPERQRAFTYGLRAVFEHGIGKPHGRKEIDHGGFAMTFGTSLFLIALGAVLRFAVSVSTSGFNIHTIGVILMIVGAVGFILSLLWMTMWADRRSRVARERVVYDDRDVPPAQRV